MPAVQQTFLMQRREAPPDAFDIVVRVRDVWMVVVQPVPDPLADLFPFGAIREHTVAAELIELCYAQFFDVLLTTEVEPFLDLDFNRQTVCVPPCLAFDTESAHRPVATEEVLDRSRKHVVNAGLAIGGRRTFEKHERWRALAANNRTREKVLVAPTFEKCLFQFRRRLILRQKGECHDDATPSSATATPRDTR